jgi:hypothetical protein
MPPVGVEPTISAGERPAEILKPCLDIGRSVKCSYLELWTNIGWQICKVLLFFREIYEDPRKIRVAFIIGTRPNHFFPQLILSINFAVTSLRTHSLIIHNTPANPKAQAPPQLSLVTADFLTVSRA